VSTPVHDPKASHYVARALQQHFLSETVYIQRQHGCVQDKNRQQSAKVTVPDESDVAGDRESAKRYHALRTERDEDKAGSKISNEYGGRHRAISRCNFQIIFAAISRPTDRSACLGHALSVCDYRDAGLTF